MKKLLLILFLPIMLNAQSLILFGGDEYGFTISLGDSNSTFSDTTSTGDWFATVNDSVYNGEDSTLIGSHIDGYIGLPLASTAGQKYRATMQMKEGESTTYKSDFSAGTDSWATAHGAIDGNIDNIGGYNDVLRYIANTETSAAGFHSGNTLVIGKWYSASLEYYLPSSNNEINGIKFYGGSYLDATLQTAQDSWTSAVETFQATGTLLFIAKYKDGSNPTSAANGDVVYLKNVKIYALSDSTQSVYAQPTITYGTKSQTKTALSDSWQNYTFDFTGEKVNDYYSFDGVDDYVSVADDNSLDFGTGGFSLEVYFYIPSTESDGYHFLVAKYNNANDGWDIGYQTINSINYINGAVNGRTLYFRNPATKLISSTQDIILNSGWSHLVATRGGDSSHVYINSVLIGSNQATNNLTNSVPLTIGGRSGELYHKGDIGKIKLYNKALSQSEVTTLYNNRNSTSPTTVTSGLVLDLNGIDGNMSKTTWTDQSGNGNNGTVNGATLWQPPFLKISLSDTAKVKIDNFILKSNKP